MLRFKEATFCTFAILELKDLFKDNVRLYLRVQLGGSAPHLQQIHQMTLKWFLKIFPAHQLHREAAEEC